MQTPSLRQRIAAEIRAELGYQYKSQDWLAREAGTNPASLSKRMTGQRAFTIDELDRIARALGIPLSRLADPPARTGSGGPTQDYDVSAGPNPAKPRKRPRTLIAAAVA